MIKKLNKIRPISHKRYSSKRIAVTILFIVLFGVSMGVLAKYTDSISIIGQIGTQLGVWVFIATLIAVFSRSAKAACLHVFIFFIAMLAAYYAYTVIVFEFVPPKYMLVWGFFALLSPLCAYVVWYARGEGWISAVCLSLPISLLISSGYSFFYTFNILQGADLVFAVLLFLIAPKDNKCRLRSLPVTAVITILIIKLEIISRIFGGL